MKYEKAVDKVVGPAPKILTKSGRGSFIERAVAAWEYDTEKIYMIGASDRRARAKDAIEKVIEAGNAGHLDDLMARVDDVTVTKAADQVIPAGKEHAEMLERFYVEELLKRLLDRFGAPARPEAPTPN